MPVDPMRKAFEAALAENRYDEASHRAFADWLLEKGLDEEATYHATWTRKRQEAEDWLRQFADDCGMTADDNYGTDDHDNTKYRQITYEDVLSIAREFAEAVSSGSRDLPYFVQIGDEKARDMMCDPVIKAKFWECFAEVTGIHIGPYDKHSSPFSCSC